MSQIKQPLVDRGYVRKKLMTPPTFNSITPPEIHSNTFIVAATHPTISSGNPTEDGWFLSDFYAFNYLLKGLGASQTWLTAADPRKLLEKYPEGYLHGNPYQDRKVVLSRQLLDDNEITTVTIVKPYNMIDRFLQEVRNASEQAKQQNAPLLLFLFCHGQENFQLLLDDGDKKRGLSPLRLKGVLDLGVQVTIVTTACYSGGWTTTPDLNSTAVVASKEGELSNSWPESNSLGRACGSVFASTLLATLSSSISPLITPIAEASSTKSPNPNNDIELEDATLQPEHPTEQQMATYNGFCTSILDHCRGIYRLWDYQTFSFCAQDDMWEYSWTGRTGFPLANFQKRWESLTTFPYEGSLELKAVKDPSPNNPQFQKNMIFSRTGGVDNVHDTIDKITESIRRKRLMEMARVFLQTCPGDWSGGHHVMLKSYLRNCIEGTQDDVKHGWHEQGWDAAELIRFRWETSLLADQIITMLDVPKPNNEICILWDRAPWRVNLENTMPGFRERCSDAWDALLKGGFSMIPTRAQGPSFTRPLAYVAAAIAAANKSEEETAALIQKAIAFITTAKKFEQHRACQDNTVRSRGRDWLQSVGRGIRRSLSPIKNTTSRYNRDRGSFSARLDSFSSRSDRRGLES